MLDVHPPHERMHGFRDFALHLMTITIGLFIALSLEGCVEWQEHRHILHDAESGLRGEIDHNSRTIPALRKQIDDQQKELDKDLNVLDQMKAHPTATPGQLGFAFNWSILDNVAWKTAQNTGALAYMSYRDASTYSMIYTMQEELLRSEKDVTDEVMRASAFPSTQPDGWVPTPAQSDEIRSHIGLLRMRLMLLTSYLDTLEKVYKISQADHP